MTWLPLAAVSTAQEAGKQAAKGTSETFLEKETWWNLYFQKDNNPLQRGSGAINAVKITGYDPRRPSWVQIRYPADRVEHMSIVHALAKARDNKSLSPADALKEWEKGIEKWETKWVNLDYVVQATRVEERASFRN